jgi:hypothetical protein
LAAVDVYKRALDWRGCGNKVLYQEFINCLKNTQLEEQVKMIKDAYEDALNFTENVRDSDQDTF